MTELILNDTVHISGEENNPAGHYFSATDLLNMAPNDTTIKAKTVGHGSFRVRDEDIRRGQRTVGVTGHTEAASFQQLDERLQELEQWAEQHVKLRLIGLGRDLWCEGIWEFTRPDELWPALTNWSAKLTCEEPWLWSSTEQKLFLQSQAAARGGLVFDEFAGISSFMWPLDWGDGGLDGNSGIVYNAGNATGGPVITVYGNYPQGVTLMDSAGRSLVYDGPVLSGAPVTFDCRPGRCTVKSSGVNRSYLLSSREWFTVPKNSDLGISFLPHTTGTGWAEVSMRDVWL